ncbi:transcription factor/nuclear export subunit protein 2-domain-containing protein [Piptocephalis cylindrospora]|uniref:THO complex subunit 2 n=1 Tax=Piptocephalis cylindrospora TaxID=1907219 RepID=A0A4P9Y6V0_9FUNG|nr:transcription factor/nuclear export subunit protein 2-domain-containing protein [Piptocephalis cylindrospora]|eukprot:RKP13590.1 transcription factor/nuclear export subunit protein 2-domain-containing protein [Piptocephalis cylindrospora]
MAKSSPKRPGSPVLSDTDLELVRRQEEAPVRLLRLLTDSLSKAIPDLVCTRPITELIYAVCQGRIPDHRVIVLLRTALHKVHLDTKASETIVLDEPYFGAPGTADHTDASPSSATPAASTPPTSSSASGATTPSHPPSESSAVSDTASPNHSGNSSDPPLHDASLQLPDIFVDVLWVVESDYQTRLDRESTKSSDSSPSSPSHSGSGTSDGIARLRRFIHLLVQSGLVPSDVILERLDIETSGAIGILQDGGGAFKRRVKQVMTTLNYRQNKFNLLREENEGYAKLVVELTTELVSFHDQGSSMEEVRIRECLSRVSALIGYFDLDPNRVLDIFLDSLTTSVPLHTHYFIRLFEASPWALPINEEGHEQRSTLSQLLGQKFLQFLPRKKVPSSLIFVAAILIRRGHLSLASLFPYLSTKEGERDEVTDGVNTHLAYMKRTLLSAEHNALASAKPLVDDSASSISTRGGTMTPSISSSDSSKAAFGAAGDQASDKQKKEGEESTESGPPPTLARLLSALLAVGGIKDGETLMDTLPHYPFLYGDCADAVNRFLHIMIEDVWAPFRPSCCSKPPSTGPQESSRRIQPTSEMEAAGTDEIFFYSDWSQGIPRAQDLSQVVPLIEPWLRRIGHQLGRSAPLFIKLCRLGTKALTQQDITDEDKEAWITLARSFLFPALCMNTGLAGPAEALYDMLATQPLDVRASLYADWESRVREPRYPGLAIQRAWQSRKINRFLRGMTSEEGKGGARRAAWALNSAPTTFFVQALQQAFEFPNLVPLMVEACKNGSSLSKDILLHTLLSLIADRAGGRRLEKEDGRSRATWLAALGTFVGLVARKHWASVSLGPVWQAVAVNLSQGTPQYLHLLQSAITEVSGVEAPPVLLTPLQLACLGGSDTLRRQSLIVLVDPAIGDSRAGTGGPPLGGRPRKAATHLLRVLVEEGLVPVLLSLVDHERRRIPYADEGEGSDEEGGMVTELVRVSYLRDWMAEIQGQLGEFVHLVGDIPVNSEDEITSTTAETASTITTPSSLHDALIPLSLSTLCGEWGLSVEGGWMLLRRRVESMVWAEEEEVHKKVEGAKKAKMDSKNKEESESKDEDRMEVDGPLFPYLPCLAEAMDTSLNLHLTPEVSLDLSPGFFVTFWQLSLRDLEVPGQAYKGIRDKLSRRIGQLGRPGLSGSMGSSQARQSDREMDRLARLIDDLAQDEEIQGGRVRATGSRLARESRAWFTSPGAQASRVAERILQHCIRPRIFWGPGDARYCAALLWRIHALGTPGFSTVLVLDNIFQNALVHWMTGTTEGEAISLGVFLDTLLSRLDRWHGNKAAYDAEAIGPGVLGFRANFHVDVPMKHGEFRKLLYKWHFRFSCFVVQAIESDDPLQIKSAIHILRAVSSLFPRVEEVAGRIQGMVESFLQRERAKPLGERRQDLIVAMDGYLGSLKVSRERWISVRQFSGMILSGPQVKEDTPGTKGAEGKGRGSGRKEEGRRDDVRKEEGEVTSHPIRTTANGDRSRDMPAKSGGGHRGEMGGGERPVGRIPTGPSSSKATAPSSASAAPNNRPAPRAGEGKKDLNALIAERTAALEAEKRRKKDNGREAGPGGSVSGGSRPPDRSRDSGNGRDRPRERERERERGRDRVRDRDRGRRSRGSTRDREMEDGRGGDSGRGNGGSAGFDETVTGGASRKRERPDDRSKMPLNGGAQGDSPPGHTAAPSPHLNVPTAPARVDPRHNGPARGGQGLKRPRLDEPALSRPRSSLPAITSSSVSAPSIPDHPGGSSSQDRDWQHRRQLDSRSGGRPGQDTREDTRRSMRGGGSGGRSVHEARGGHRVDPSMRGTGRPSMDARQSNDVILTSSTITNLSHSPHSPLIVAQILKDQTPTLLDNFRTSVASSGIRSLCISLRTPPMAVGAVEEGQIGAGDGGDLFDPKN